MYPRVLSSSSFRFSQKPQITIMKTIKPYGFRDPCSDSAVCFEPALPYTS